MDDKKEDHGVVAGNLYNHSETVAIAKSLALIMHIT